MATRKESLTLDLLVAQIAEQKAETAYYKAESEKLRYQAQRERLNYEIDERDERANSAHHHYARTYFFTDPVTAYTAEKCIKMLGKWSRENLDPIRLIINSPGGDVIEGLALYDTIFDLRSQGIHVTTKTIGMAASMGGILLQAGDVRIASANSEMLIHEVSSVSFGKTAEMEDELKFTKRLQEKCVNILAERSAISASAIKLKWKRKDWWLSAEDMLDLGFVDAIA